MTESAKRITSGLLVCIVCAWSSHSQDFFAGDSVWGKDTVPGVNFTTGPEPGAVFRDYIATPKHHWWGPGADAKPTNPPVKYGSRFTISGVDLDKAVRAEMSFESWGGHIGTSGKRVSVNGKDDQVVHFPMPRNTNDTLPNCFFHTLLGNSSRPFPLSYLVKGTNSFTFMESPQICHVFRNNWPHYHVYSATLRIYYEANKPHPTGQIVSPKLDARIYDNVVVEASATSTSSTISRVDFFGYYEDYDWEGNGIYRQWHYITQNRVLGKGTFTNHIGTAKSKPFKVTWNTKWLPDQRLPMKIMARITDGTGMSYMTPASSGLWLLRKGHSIRLYKAIDVPQKFQAGNMATKTCKIATGPEAAQATEGLLAFTTWSCQTNPRHCPGTNNPTLKINSKAFGVKFGIAHDYTLVTLPIAPATVAEASPAIFLVKSVCRGGHACEINWPGPAIFLKYPFADTTIDTTTTDTTSPGMGQRSRSGVEQGFHRVSLSVRSRLASMSFRVPAGTPYRFTLANTQGQIVKSHAGSGPVNRRVRFAGQQGTGVYLAHLKTGRGEISRRIVMMR